MVSRRPPFRFGLRSLLLATLLVGGGLGWWLRPYTITKRWPNGNLQYELNVRRAWNGDLLTNGRQRWWWSNGQLAREGMSFRRELPRTFESLPLDNEQCWFIDGDPMRKPSIFAIVWLLNTLDSQGEQEVDWSQFRFAETEYDR